MSRVIVTLLPDEREALTELALTQLRTPRDQARFIIRRELERLGMLPEQSGSNEPEIKRGQYES